MLVMMGVGCTCSPRRSTIPLPAIPAGRNLSRMNTYAKCSANPCGMRTSKIIGLKASYNEHLQKMGGGVELLVTLQPCKSRRRAVMFNREDVASIANQRSDTL